MSDILEITWPGLGVSYLLLLFPLAIFLYLGVDRAGRTLMAVARMTAQLLFVGFYLQVLFALNHPGVNLLWLLVMILVADGTVLSGCKLRVRLFAVPLFLAILLGTALPALLFTAGILRLDNPLEAQYLIPVGGMILGNCLRADVIGLQRFTEALKTRENQYLQALAQGAKRGEAVRPFLAEALRASLDPTLATMATIGLVSLPGMMTGVILAGTNPATAIRYQIAIMTAIFTGTALTVFLALILAVPRCFTPHGVPRPDLSRP